MVRLIEVPAELNETADSALRFTTIAFAQWAIRNFVLDRPVSLQQTLTDNAMVVAGLGLFHLVVDKMIMRVTVKRGEEGYYHAMVRHR